MEMHIPTLSKKHKLWFLVSFTSLIVAGILGSILRYAFAGELPAWLFYKNILHAHSHVAMMGWIFGGLYTLICYLFDLKTKIYTYVFWMVQVSMAGMLISFIIQGYGLVSIFFTTIHLVLSYIFVYHLISDLKDNQSNVLGDHAAIFLKTAGILLVVSTLGTWALGIIMNTSLKGSALYYASIQFFLHFQFNGWFVFGIIAIFLKLCSYNMDIKDLTNLSKAYWLLLISCILTYALSVTWSTPENVIFWINSIGVLVQAFALLYIIKAVKEFWNNINSGLKPWSRTLFLFAFYGLIFKILIQTLVAIPHLATISYTIKNFVIGFIHLLMLGTISTFLFAVFELHIPRGRRIGLWLFIAGFLLSEAILFIQGLMLWQEMGFMPSYYTIILIISMLMPLGFILYFRIILRSLKEYP